MCQELANGMSELQEGEMALDMEEEDVQRSDEVSVVSPPTNSPITAGLPSPPPIELVPWFGQVVEEEEEVTAAAETTQPPSVVMGPAESRKKRNKHKRKAFLMEVINKTKNHFGGVPKPSESNIVSVTRYVKDVCDEHNLVPYQTRLCIAYCVPLIMSPDEIDIQSKAYLCGIESSQRRARARDAGTLEGWLSGLVNSPLSGLAWRRAVNALFGKADAVAFTLVR